MVYEQLINIRVRTKQTVVILQFILNYFIVSN